MTEFDTPHQPPPSSPVELLRSTIAGFFDQPVGTIDSAFVMSGPRLGNSISRGKLDAIIRRQVGVRLASVHTARTFGDLESEITGQPASTESTPVAPTAVQIPRDSVLATDRLRCGVDIEMVASLPPTADYWEHPFYQTHFTRTEIAYCLMQEKPLVHFAGRWCAKEALKKCDGNFLREEMTSIEVVSAPSGIELRHLSTNGWRELPHALSISHTGMAAIAMVVLSPAPMPAREDATISRPAVAGHGRILPLLISLLAAAIALVALWRVMHLR